VTVSTSGGLLTFQIHTASAAAWPGASADLMVDSDANYATGHNDGVDYLFTFHSDGRFDAGRWSGTSFDPYGSKATGTLNGDTLTITVPLRELGNTRKLAFAVLTSTATALGDQAPDGSFAPSTPPRWIFRPSIVTSIRAAFTPRLPVHGKAFALKSTTAMFSDGTSRSASATCRALLGGQALTGCRWKIPGRAKGRRLTVTIRAAGLSRSYAFRVA
jgi:hypothetical protein